MKPRWIRIEELKSYLPLLVLRRPDRVEHRLLKGQLALPVLRPLDTAGLPIIFCLTDPRWGRTQSLKGYQFLLELLTQSDVKQALKRTHLSSYLEPQVVLLHEVEFFFNGFC